jgi:3-oxoacyl-[acyl-carrier protein] reductase
LKIKDSIVIVTGGASGLGLGIALELLNNGAKVIILDVDNKKLTPLNNKFDTYNVDITNYDLVQDVVHDIVKQHDKVDVLINNAGVIYNEPLINLTNPSNMKHSYDNFKKNININLNSVFIMSSIVIEQMVLKRTKGVVINISSISANGNAGQTAYSAAKAGVEAMTKTWAKELGAFGIRNVAISPGFIDTDSTNEALNSQTIKHIKRNTPLKRLGEVVNIAQGIVYAIENDFVNGTVLEIDGGLII